MTNVVHLGDCMDGMCDKPDNYYDLAIVDPPYGIGAGEFGWGDKISKGWDSDRPKQEYFNELFRMARDVFIFGANYFIDYLKPSKNIVIWDKENGKSFANDGEMIWTTKGTGFRIYREFWISNMIRPKNMPRIHPTQKPIDLYCWMLTNYAKPGDTILDTHVGSGSSRIACHDMGFDFEGWEIDADYWRAQEDRYKKHIQQSELFVFEGGRIK